MKKPHNKRQNNRFLEGDRLEDCESDFSRWGIELLMSEYRVMYEKRLILPSYRGDLDHIVKELLSRDGSEIERGLDILKYRRRVFEEKEMPEQVILYKEIIRHYYENVILEHNQS